MKKEVRFLKIFVLLTFVVLLTGCSDDWVCDIPFVCSDSQVNEAAKTNNPDACDDLSYPDDPEREISKKNLCFKKVAVNTNNLDVCDRITDNQGLKNSCIKDIAINLQDEVFCIDITDDKKRLEDCYVDIGIARGDEVLCAESTSAFNEKRCYTKVAEIKKDVTICDNIELENNRADCYLEIAVLTEDVQICNDITFGFERNKINCIKKLAIAKSDYNICDELRDNDLETDCIFDVATRTNNLGACLFIGSESLSSKCIGVIAKNVKDINICDDYLLLEKDGSWEACVTHVAIARKDTKVCQEITGDERHRVNCLVDVAESKGEYEICNEVPSKDFDRCIISASYKADDTLYCDKLGAGNNKKYVCVRNVALNTKDASFCVEELEGRDLDQCMGAVIQEHRNKRVCGFIDDLEMEKRCLSFLE